MNRLRLLIVSYRISIISFLIFIFLSCSGHHPPPVKIPVVRSDSSEKIYLAINGSAKTKALESYFDELYKKRGFNGTVLVSQRGVVLFKAAYGVANYHKKSGLNTETSFQLASVSKQFTAVAIMQLIEKGKLSYDDKVQKFFPGFPYPDITIRLLLEHRSGLMNYIYFCDKYVKDKVKPISNSTVVSMINALKPPAYGLPDKRFSYSNTGYMLLAAIVEKVTGTPFRDYMKSNIFDSLGMKNTFILDPARNLPSNIATGYNGRWREAEYTFLDGVTGDKGVYSSVEDLFKWDQGLYENKIIKKSTLDDAFQPRGKKATARKNYGFGWRMVYLSDSTKLLYHSGWWEGFQTLLMRVEKDHSTIVVLKNRKTAPIVDKDKILQILYPNLNPKSKKEDWDSGETDGAGGN